MPIYLYECSQGHRTERVKSIRVSDQELEKDTCETCKQDAKLVPARIARPVLKGTGFHENDYRHGKLGS